MGYIDADWWLSNQVGFSRKGHRGVIAASVAASRWAAPSSMTR